MLGIQDGMLHFCPAMLSFPSYDDAPFCCLECGEPLGYGRHDKKFCSAQCKNKYHNQRRYPGLDKPVARIVKILESNRLILARLYKMGIRNIDRLTLQHMGFNPGYYTSFCLVSKIHKQFTCFDYTYELTPSRVKRISWIMQEEQPTREGAGKKKRKTTAWQPSSEDL